MKLPPIGLYEFPKKPHLSLLENAYVLIPRGLGETLICRLFLLEMRGRTVRRGNFVLRCEMKTVIRSRLEICRRLSLL